MTSCSTLDSALSLGQKPLLMQGKEELPTLNHSQMLNHVSFYNSMNETWLHIHTYIHTTNIYDAPFPKGSRRLQ